MPEKASISPEQWPYRIVSTSAAPALETRFPALLPKTSANSPEQRGLRVFVVNCSVCHKLNGAGDAAVGPDLNEPYNPTEYFEEPFLRKLIRAPASVRDWGQRIMRGFSPSVLTDAQLDDLLATFARWLVSDWLSLRNGGAGCFLRSNVEWLIINYRTFSQSTVTVRWHKSIRHFVCPR